MTLIARVLLFIVIVALAAAAGTVVAFFGSYLLATLLGASDVNGGLAMGAAGLAPWGGAIGAGVGAWYGWGLVRRIGKGAAMAGGYGTVTLVALCVGGWFLAQDLTDGDPYTLEEEPTLLIEWRLPETVPHEMVDRIFRFSMRSTYVDWSLSTWWDESSSSGARPTTTTALRSISISATTLKPRTTTGRGVRSRACPETRSGHGLSSPTKLLFAA